MDDDVYFGGDDQHHGSRRQREWSRVERPPRGGQPYPWDLVGVLLWPQPA